ncbi:MAG TPA: hypothetical protein VH395_11540 [Jatrophihabitantaceae bacterium]|jgi:hypothetical protein
MNPRQQDGVAVSVGDGESVDVPGRGGRLGMDVSESVAPGGEESDGEPVSGAEEDDAPDDAQDGAVEDALDDAVGVRAVALADPDRGVADLVCAGLVDAPPAPGEFESGAGGPGFTGGSGGVVRGGFGGCGPTGTTRPTPAA